MADDNAPTQKSQLRPVWNDQLQRLIAYANADWQAMQLAAIGMWYQPKIEGQWSGDLFDLQGMSQPFSRDEHEQDFASVMTDPSQAGCAGDLMAIQLQGDMLGSLERAFRERHKTWPRMMVHANARRYGHQHDYGVFRTGFLGYLQFILRQSGGDSPGAG